MTIRLTVIVLMLFAGTADSADLGRLFFTPAQRATLDNARKQNIRIEIGSDTEQARSPVPQNVSVNGVVRRSDGKTTVWLNNRAVTGRQAGGINVSTNKNDSRVRLSAPESGRSVDLKVGQTVEIVSGTIAESYSRRAKSETKAVPDAGNTAVTGDKAAPSQAAPPPKPIDEAQKREARNKELEAQSGLQRNNNAQSK